MVLRLQNKPSASSILRYLHTFVQVNCWLTLWYFSLFVACKCSANPKNWIKGNGFFLLKNTFFNIHRRFWVTKYFMQIFNCDDFHQAIQLWINCSLNHAHDQLPVQIFICFVTEHLYPAFEGGFYLTAITILFQLISLLCSCSPPLEFVSNRQFLAAYGYYSNYDKYWSQSTVNS